MVFIRDFNQAIKLQPDNNAVSIEIADNGPGMEPETQKRIFEPFYTTKGSGVGTGLGLSVSYFIIKNEHRGNMAVTSAPGKGSTFIIHLPLDTENHERKDDPN